jgi:pimeloyl-ACP methyl ester carboxylesterase
MPVLSDNPLWEAFGLRALAYTYYGGADLGECFSTIDKIGLGTGEDWHREWTNTADRIFAAGRTAELAGHTVSARETYFRATSYYRVSYIPLFGAPVDPRLANAFVRETEAFQSAARLNDFPIEPVEIPFEGNLLPGYFIRISGDETPRPTLIWVSGYDSDIQEDYFAHGPAAVRRGYNCLVVDGPGQGRNLIRDAIPLRPDWETVVRAVVDFAETRKEVDTQRMILAGWSFGGFLAPRAAAFEKRIAALIADPGQWDQREGLKSIPLAPGVLAAFPHVDPAVFSPFEEYLHSPKADPLTRWKILQRGFWVHGVNCLYDLAREMNRFEVSSVAQNISCPTLITAAEGDPVSSNAHTLFDALRCPKTMIRFTIAEGSGGHCEALARSLFHQRMFDWLDETLASATTGSGKKQERQTMLI